MGVQKSVPTEETFLQRVRKRGTPVVIWLIGLSGAGKTFIGKSLYERIKIKHANTVFLDGDLIREVMGNDLGHSLEGRRKNADRICRLCRLLDQQGINVVCSILSLFHESQEWNRSHLKEYFEVFIDTPMPLLQQRRDLYQKALSGEIKNVVGVDIPFNPPKNPDLVIKNASASSPDPFVQEILSKIPGLT